jgi:hypothetical protein
VECGEARQLILSMYHGCSVTAVVRPLCTYRRKLLACNATNAVAVLLCDSSFLAAPSNSFQMQGGYTDVSPEI